MQIGSNREREREREGEKISHSLPSSSSIPLSFNKLSMYADIVKILWLQIIK